MIIAYCGLLGQGKTLGMVQRGLEMLRDDRLMVYTNMAGLKFPEAVYFDHIEELTNIQSGIVLLDEAMIVVPARFWTEQGRELLARFAQLRKVGLHLLYTSQLADGVDKTLRELTNEIIVCEKWAGYFRQSRYNPSRKMNVGGRFRKFNPQIAALYNTLEVIHHTGGSAGLPGPSALQSRVALRRSERDARLEEAARRSSDRPLLQERFWSGWWGDVTHLRLGLSARKALGWLQVHGLFSEDDPWHAQVRRELARRKWLSLFKFGPDDAPWDCTPESPWLTGHDPRTVKLRRLELEEERASELLMLKREARRNGKLALA